MSKIFAIMSGKGGVGKSTVSAALAELYARQGLKVTLVDGDVGLRCADLMLGMQDRVVYDLGDWTQSACTHGASDTCRKPIGKSGFLPIWRDT